MQIMFYFATKLTKCSFIASCFICYLIYLKDKSNTLFYNNIPYPVIDLHPANLEKPYGFRSYASKVKKIYYKL